MNNYQDNEYANITNGYLLEKDKLGISIFPVSTGTDIPFSHKEGSKGYYIMLRASLGQKIYPSEILQYKENGKLENWACFAGVKSNLTVIQITPKFIEQCDSGKHPWGYEFIENLESNTSRLYASTGDYEDRYYSFSYCPELLHGRFDELGINIYNSSEDYLLLEQSIVIHPDRRKTFYLGEISNRAALNKLLLKDLIKAIRTSHSNQHIRYIQKGHRPPNELTEIESLYDVSIGFIRVPTPTKGSQKYSQLKRNRVRFDNRKSITVNNSNFDSYLADLVKEYELDLTNESSFLTDSLEELKDTFRQRQKFELSNRNYYEITDKKVTKYIRRYGYYFYPINTKYRYFPTAENLNNNNNGLIVISPELVIVQWKKNKNSNKPANWYPLLLDSGYSLDDLFGNNLTIRY